MSRVDRIQLFYNLTFQTPFHCGTGLRSGLIDRAIVRDVEMRGLRGAIEQPQQSAYRHAQAPRSLRPARFGV